MVKETKTATYTGKDIKELPFPQCVQQRSGMYIGTNDFGGMLVTIREIINNSVDEHLSGNCTTIKIHRKSEFGFSIKDNGRGVPFDTVRGKNSLERIFGTLHAGRNFDEAKEFYGTGVNGVGSSLTNALSESFRVTSVRGKDTGTILFNDGYKKELNVSKIKKTSPKPFDKSSTEVEFTLNPKYFDKDLEVDNEALKSLIYETAYLNNGLTIIYQDDVLSINDTICVSSGVNNLLDKYHGKDKMFKKNISFKEAVVGDKATANRIEVAFNYSTEFSKPEEIQSYCNTIKTSEGGSHVTGFKRSFSQKLLAYISANNLCKEKVTNEDVYNGLQAFVSVFVYNPKYTSQTKTCLKNNEVMGNVVKYMNQALDNWLDTKPTEVKAIATRINSIAKARLAQKRALEASKKDSQKSIFGSLSDISKFSDCETQNNALTELFIVEGNSAGGTVQEGRDKNYQALYKLKGKVLNTLGKEVTKIRENKEIDDLVSILRCGTGNNLSLEKLKFNKIIILADADNDGKPYI